MRYLMLAMFSIGLFSCTDTNTPVSAPTGDLMGVVWLYDYEGHELPDRSGVKVECEGTPYLGISDSAGKWIIHGLPTRSYSIMFSKSGFLPRHNYSFGFVAGSPINYWGTVQLGQPPRFSIILDKIILPTRSYDPTSDKYSYTNGSVMAHTSGPLPDSVQIHVICSISKDSTTPFTKGLMPEFSVGASTKIVQQDSIWNIIIPLEYQNQLTAMGFMTNDVLYFQCFPSVNLWTEYGVLPGLETYAGWGQNGSQILSMTMQ